MGTPLYQKRCGQYGGYALSPADNFKRSKSWKSLHRGGRGRGRRGTNRELRGRSCEKPRARGPARGYIRCERRRCGRQRRRFGTLSLRRPVAACPRPAHPKPPYRLQPLFCVNISHYLKYVRSKFPGLSYSGRKAMVISHFGVRPLSTTYHQSGWAP